MVLLDGKSLADQIISDLKTKIDPNSPPQFDIVLVGDNQASLKYISLKSKQAKSIGIDAFIHHLPSSTPVDEIVNLIDTLNHNPHHGLMVQLPLPDGIDKNLVLNSIDPTKDIDGLTAKNLGLLFQSDSTALVSATAMAIFNLLLHYKIDLVGKNITIVNNTPLVGLPLAALFNNAGATVTLNHKLSRDITLFTKSADIVVTAVGIPRFLTSSMVKKDTIVIGAGFGRDLQTGKLAGDLDFESLSRVCSYLTPNTGGVGPLTIACLLENLVKIYQKHGLS